MDLSIVEYFGNDGQGNPCGYCKQENTSLSHGMWAHKLTCQDYEDLLNRGWRRSGKYCYKPIMNETCCPQYTIRCDVANFKLTKSQKKVIKKFNKFIATGVKPSDGHGNNYAHNESNPEEFGCNGTRASNTKLECDSTATNASHTSQIEKQCGASSATHKEMQKKKAKQPEGADPSKPPCRKAKDMRRERKKQKLAKSRTGNNAFDMEQEEQKSVKEKSIEDFIEDIPSNSLHKFEIKLVRCCPISTEFERSFREECDMFRKYQIYIHKEKEEDCGEKQFRRFLVDGPLQNVTKNNDNDQIPSCGLGAFHQQYYIDGKLIAVGVLDVLPHCVSSKYLFYDPDYSFLSLGTYSALREVYFVRLLQREYSAMRHYYMGYYIHSCPKMKYKGRYHPSYLLCPETYLWQPYESCVAKLDANKFSRLEEDKSKKSKPIDANNSLILNYSRAMTYEVFLSRIESNEVSKQTLEISEYSNLAGIAASRMLLYRS